jgi:hypothetical protein
MRLREESSALGAVLREVAPLPTDPFRKQRVRRALSRGPRPIPRLRFAVTSIACVLVLSAFASAMSGRVSWRAPAPALLSSHEVIDVTAAPRVRTSTLVIPLAAVERETTPRESGATLMLAALRAAHQPLEAEAKATRYLQKYPRGPLREEAYAVVIGAKVSLHDPAVARVAADYLAQFPDGRFVELARNAR